MGYASKCRHDKGTGSMPQWTKCAEGWLIRRASGRPVLSKMAAPGGRDPVGIRRVHNSPRQALASSAGVNDANSAATSRCNCCNSSSFPRNAFSRATMALRRMGIAPTGQRHKAQGLRGASYPGSTVQNELQLQRSCAKPMRRRGRNPVGVGNDSHDKPRVARPSQPLG